MAKTIKKTAKKATAKTAKKTSKKSAAKGTSAGSPDQAEITREFKSLVNMTPGQIETFLSTKTSKKVGFKQGGVGGTGESVGHKSGRLIIAIKAKKAGELNADDLKHMRKVIGYIKRHLAQGPDKNADVKDSRWRASLMNWGHDPMKKK